MVSGSRTAHSATPFGQIGELRVDASGGIKATLQINKGTQGESTKNIKKSYLLEYIVLSQNEPLLCILHKDVATQMRQCIANCAKVDYFAEFL